MLPTELGRFNRDRTETAVSPSSAQTGFGELGGERGGIKGFNHEHTVRDSRIGTSGALATGFRSSKGA